MEIDHNTLITTPLKSIKYLGKEITYIKGLMLNPRAELKQTFFSMSA